MVVYYCLILWLIVCLRVRPSAENSGSDGKVESRDINSYRPLSNNQSDSSELNEETTCQGDNKNHDYELIFKNPECILGKGFNSTVGKTVCEARVHTRGNEVECIRYTKRGEAMCSKICVKQDQKIMRVSPTVVMMTDNYCTKKRLKPATCVCVYKLSCREYKHFVFIHFIPNRDGEIAMLYKECGHPLLKPL